MANTLNESQVMAAMRNELLTVLYEQLPVNMTKEQLMIACQTPFLCRDKEWYKQSIDKQMKVLDHAGLVRPMCGGYTLTEKGKQDRQQAARFFGRKKPPEPA